MSVADCHAVVTSRNGRWAMLRVRGLLRNAALAGRLASAAGDAVDIRVETGSIRVRLAPERDEAFWIDWVSDVVGTHSTRSTRPPAAAPAAPAPATRPVRG